MSDVQGLFDAVIQKYPETEWKLTQFADIVHSPILEIAIVKFQMSSGCILSTEEKVLLRPF